MIVKLLFPHFDSNERVYKKRTSLGSKLIYAYLNNQKHIENEGKPTVFLTLMWSLLLLMFCDVLFWSSHIFAEIRRIFDVLL